MELAKLFATVGFKVDKDGLTEFRKEMASLKGDLKEAAIQTGKLKNQLTGLTAQFKSFQKMTDTKGVTKWMDGIEKSITHLNNMQVAVGGQAERSTHWADAFSSSIFKLHQAITGRKNEIAEYAQAIMLLAANFERLKAATAGVSRFRQVPRSAISEGQGGYGGAREGAGRPRGGGNGYESNQYVGYWGRASGIAKSPMAAMLRPMLPTGMGLFNAVAGGYAIKELIAAGREMMQMENMLKAISGDTQTFNSNLKFVKQTADELGISVLDLGQGFAKMFMSGKEQFSTDVLQKSFKGAQTYFRLLGMSAEKIKLANKAIEQMFNKQRVNAEDLRGQLGEHAAGVMGYFAQAAGTDVAGLTNLMEHGKVSTDVLVKALLAMGAFADASPELQKQLKMSAAAQGRFNNKLLEFSQVMMESGLDEVLTELFSVLSKLVTILTPVFKSIAKIVKGLSDLASILWSNRGIIAGTLALIIPLGLVGSALGLLGMKAFVASWKTGYLVSQFIALHGAMIRLMGLFGALLYIFDSYNDYMNGEDNWLHAFTLILEIAALSWDNFVLDVLIGWDTIKRALSGEDLKPLEGVKGLVNMLPGPLGSMARAGVGIGESIIDNLTNSPLLNAPSTPVIQTPSKGVWNQSGLEKPSSMNFNINFNEMPTSAKEALQRGDIKEFGIGIGQGLRVGGLGIYS